MMEVQINVRLDGFTAFKVNSDVASCVCESESKQGPIWGEPL